MPYTRIQVKKCEKCLVYYPTKSVHQCILVAVTVKKPKKLRKILPAENIEKKGSLLSSDDDVDENKINDFDLTSSLISAIKVRPPLFDHRMSSSERSEKIKKKLWNEVYTELKGQVTLDELKKKWKYLKEKYVRERHKPIKSGIRKRSINTKWLYYAQLSFLEEVIIKYQNEKSTNIRDSNLDSYTEDFSQSLATAKEQRRKIKNDLRRHLLNEYIMSRPELSAKLNEDTYDPDVAFGNYLIALMKDLPIKKRKIVQCQFIASVIAAQDSD